MMTVKEFNATVADGSVSEIIRVAEARQSKVLSKMADEICARESVRLVLLAGGSAAGKTTSSKRLSTQLRVNDRAVIALSTDDYFVGDAETPRDEEGKLDYEHIDCVDIAQLVKDMNDLAEGKPIRERKFNFAKHSPYNTGKELSLPKGGMIVLEGIHALNPRLTEGVPDERKYRVSIVPKPSLQLDDGTFPSATDSRFLRRLIRDFAFRKRDPVTTLDGWESVLRGEERWINPFIPSADASFDSYLVYELALLKTYVRPLLEQIYDRLGDHYVITRSIEIFDAIEAIPATSVPGDSIIRETIGGSQLEY